MEEEVHLAASIIDMKSIKPVFAEISVSIKRIINIEKLMYFKISNK